MFHINYRKINPTFLYLPSIFCVVHNVQDSLNISNLHLYWKTRCHRLLSYVRVKISVYFYSRQKYCTFISTMYYMILLSKIIFIDIWHMTEWVMASKNSSIYFSIYTNTRDRICYKNACCNRINKTYILLFVFISFRDTPNIRHVACYLNT